MRVRTIIAIGIVSGAGFPVAGRAADVKLRLQPEMIVNETGLGDATRLVDEQAVVGEPPSRAPGKRPERAYFVGWKDWMYPAHAIVDLGPDQKAGRLALFNETGKSTVAIATGTPARWDPPRTLVLDRYRGWHEIVLPAATRYVRITMTRPVALPELVAYGERSEPIPTPVAPRPRREPRPTFDRFLGTNAFIDDPIDKLVPVAGTLREYHNAGWDVEAPDHRLRFQPSGAAGGNLWFFDDFYAKLHRDGVTVSPCLQQSFPWVTGNKELDARPARRDSDPADPAAYDEHAAHMFQLAARYGGLAVPDAILQLGPGQPRRSGLGTIRYFENANEPDKNWKERACMSTPFELAVQCSADYDGHRGALGPGRGIRAADPDARMVMAGLYREPLAYLDAMRFWAEHHRGGSFPADVINVHFYCGDGDAEQVFKTRGVCPEDGGLRRRAAAIVAWRDRHLPGAEVWVSEFGYDVHPGSPLHAPALGSLAAEVVQAAWLVRSELLLAAAGVDRAMMYMFRDVDPESPGVFATSGLVGPKGRWNLKPSWHFQATLKRHLAGMRWDADVPTGRSGVVAMRLAGGGRTAFAVWCPTSEDRRERLVRLPVAGSRARLVELAAGQAAGRVHDLPVNDGAVTLDVSEVPSLVLVD